ncbi:MAG: alkaline phosphatase family protein [Candidatus Kapaibacterium sp.]
MAPIFLFLLGILAGFPSASQKFMEHANSKINHKSHSTPKGIKKIGHIIVLYLENHSFDNLYGEFPGADGLSNAKPQNYTQIDTATGRPYATLPWNDNHFQPTPHLPDKYFNIDQYLPPSALTLDLVHRYYQEREQIDGGKMDKFATISSAKGLSMGYYHTSDFPIATQEAANYTLCDHCFHSALGGSWLNHVWLIAAATPKWEDAPQSMRAVLDGKGYIKKDGAITPDGYIINTVYSVNEPHPSDVNPKKLIPNLTIPTIGDRLTAAHIDWAWYSGGWDDALAGHPDSLFEYHHQPFMYFKNYADGTAAKAEHLKDEKDFVEAAKAGTLPAVSFWKPIGEWDEHPGYSNVMAGEEHLEELINDIRNGPDWKDCVIIVTYDEHGGFWDHVAPPKLDKWGPGSRVPAIIISPFAKKHFVDHTQYETVSILSLIEKRWNLKPLSSRDARATPFTNALKF